MKRMLALALLVTVPALAAPPQLASVSPVLGPKVFRDGDVVEITDVVATSAKLEQGDTVVVKGRARLDSRAGATLSLYLTQTVGNGTEETDATQTASVARGMQDFELKMTIKHQGMLHLTFYDNSTGRPFGGVYFGTAGQMKQMEAWDLSYYLKD